MGLSENKVAQSLNHGESTIFSTKMTICTSVKILQFSDKPNGAGDYSQAHPRSIAVADPFWHSCRGIQISPTQVLESSRPQSSPKICLDMGIYPSYVLFQATKS